MTEPERNVNMNWAQIGADRMQSGLVPLFGELSQAAVLADASKLLTTVATFSGTSETSIERWLSSWTPLPPKKRRLDMTAIGRIISWQAVLSTLAHCYSHVDLGVFDHIDNPSAPAPDFNAQELHAFLAFACQFYLTLVPKKHPMIAPLLPLIETQACMF